MRERAKKGSYFTFIVSMNKKYKIIYINLMRSEYI